MKMQKMMEISKAIKLLRNGTVGQGELTCGTIAWWMMASKSQINRDLRKMEQIGLVEKQIRSYKNTTLHSWFLTDAGSDFEKSKKEPL